MTSSRDSNQNSTTDKIVEYTLKINKNISFTLQINSDNKEINFNI